MTYLLSEEGRRALSTLTEKPILYAFDFDGTLAPISPDRDTVKIPRSVSERLKELANRAPCACDFRSGTCRSHATGRQGGSSLDREPWVGKPMHCPHDSDLG